MPSATSTTRDYYDAYWQPGGFAPTRQPLPPALRSLLERNVASGARVIDVGCGDGSKVGAWIAGRGASYTGYDVSAEAVRIARVSGLEAEVVPDAAALPAPDGDADVALCLEVLEHLLDPLGAAREMRRVVRGGGRLVVTVPNVANWRSRLDLALLGRWHPGGDDRGVAEPWRDPHIRFFTPRTLGAMLGEAGWDVLELGGLEELSAAHRLPGLSRSFGRRPAGAPTHLAARVAPAVFATRLHAVAAAR